MKNLLLKHNDKDIKMSIYIAKSSCVTLDHNIILSQSELKKYNSFKTESGKKEFLLGRYSAKQAYMQSTHQCNFNDIEIKNGIFEQPFFVNNSEFDVSIAHTKGIGGAVVFDRAFPMGLDIETIDTTKIESMQLMTKDEEINQLDVTLEAALTIAWCLKESLSKAIKTGLTLPLELLEIENLITSNGFFECRFTNFTQYKGISKIKGNYVTALVYPKQLAVGGV